MDMLSTSMSSASAISIAAIMMSAVLPAQPKTRYAPKVTPGATPSAPPAAGLPFAPMIPETCVPCPLQSSGEGSGEGVGL
jgi:hypothetical protein